jgi:hypothetical protein
MLDEKIGTQLKDVTESIRHREADAAFAVSERRRAGKNAPGA